MVLFYILAIIITDTPSVILGVNNIIKNNIFLRPEEAMLKTWWKLVSESTIFCL